MKRLCVVLLLMAVAFHSLSAENDSGAGIPRAIDLENCKVMRIFARVWKFSPLVETEKAVWIVLDSNGEYQQIDWLTTPERRLVTWYEAVPENTVAQAHTHGDNLDPKPSGADVSLARKINVPVYTLARKGIWKAAPDGSVTKEVDRGWFDKTMKKCGKG